MTTTEWCGGCSGSSDSGLSRVDHEANHLDWDTAGRSYQAYQVYLCGECGSYWGCRHQWDAGTGVDDRWHRFGVVDPAEIRRHY